MKLDHVKRAIAFGAHPDDIEVGAGGLVAKLTAAGAQVTMVVCSIPNQYEKRRAEATAAAATLGAALVLPPPDETGARVEDVPMHALVARFEREIAATDPDLAITHGGRDSHNDHIIVHRAVMSALRRTRCDILAYATRLPAGASPPPPTAIVDISAVIDAKCAAIAEHRSQFPPDFADQRRDMHRTLGTMHGLASAELFEVLRITL